MNGSWSFVEVDCVLLHVTNACNLRCAYCNVNAGDVGPDGIMPLKVFSDLLDTLGYESRKKAIAIIFQGGEPLLAGLPWLRRAVAWVRKKETATGKRFRLSLQTNGTLLTDKHAVFLRDNDISVGASLDGPRDIHDSIRGAYDEARQGLTVLDRNNVPYGQICVVSRPVADRIEEVLAFFEAEGLHHVQFNLLHNSGRGRGVEGLGEERMFRVYRAVLDYMLDFRHDLVDTHTKRRVYEFAGYKSKKRTSSCHQRICSAGIEFVAVTAEGKVFPCGACIYPDYELGATIGARREDRRAFFQSLFRKHLYEHCPSCHAARICDYGCVAVHAEDPGHFGDMCRATQRIYAYMESRRGKVQALADRLYARRFSGTEAEQSARELLLRLRKNLFRAMENSGTTVCAVDERGGEVWATVAADERPLASFDHMEAISS